MSRHFNIILILLLSITISTFAQNKIIKKADNYISKDFNELLFISLKNQRLYHIKHKKIINTFSISSSKYGTGNKNGSNKTPLGLHKIKEKYGEETPINGKMVGRIFYGKIALGH